MEGKRAHRYGFRTIHFHVVNDDPIHPNTTPSKAHRILSPTNVAPVCNPSISSILANRWAVPLARPSLPDKLSHDDQPFDLTLLQIAEEVTLAHSGDLDWDHSDSLANPACPRPFLSGRVVKRAEDRSFPFRTGQPFEEPPRLKEILFAWPPPTGWRCCPGCGSL